VVDGGSTDDTIQIAISNGAKVINNPHKLTEPGVALGFRRAKADLIMVLAVDNLFKDPDSIQSIIRVFENPHVVAAFPKHDTGPRDNIYSWYLNTFTDPLTHFVYGNAANARTFHKVYKTIVSNPLYDIYDYSSSPVKPIIALAQGFTVRKEAMPKRKEVSDDVLTVYKLLEEGRQIGYVHSVT